MPLKTELKFTQMSSFYLLFCLPIRSFVQACGLLYKKLIFRRAWRLTTNRRCLTSENSTDLKL